MNITLTVTGDAINPEIAKMLQALGIALSNEKKAATDPEITEEKQSETPAEQSTKKTRKQKAAKPETEDTAADEEPKSADRLTLETLREKAMEVLNAGKSTEFKKVLAEFDLKSLSDAKKEDYTALYEKINQL